MRRGRDLGRAGAVLAVVAGVALAAGSSAPAKEEPRPAKARAAQAPALSAEEARLIELVTAYRRSKGLSGLTVYPNLLREARWYAADMAVNDAFSVTHVDSLGRTIDQRFWDFGYPFTVALGQATASGGLTAEETFEQLRTSRLHDEIMRDPRFRLVGAGYGFNSATDSKAFWVISFAKYRIPSATTVKASRARAARAKAARAKKARRTKR